jgi:hypothetical protein
MTRALAASSTNTSEPPKAQFTATDTILAPYRDELIACPGEVTLPWPVRADLPPFYPVRAMLLERPAR